MEIHKLGWTNTDNSLVAVVSRNSAMLDGTKLSRSALRGVKKISIARQPLSWSVSSRMFIFIVHEGLLQPLDQSHLIYYASLLVSLVADLIQASDVSHTMQHWHIYRVCSPKDESVHVFLLVRAHTRRSSFPSLTYRNGTKGCLWRCTQLSKQADLRTILLTSGQRVKLDFLTSTVSFL